MRLAVWRGVTVAEISDCLLEHGVRISPQQIRALLDAGKAVGRPPSTEALTIGVGPVSALVPHKGRKPRTSKRRIKAASAKHQDDISKASASHHDHITGS